ncbi:nucleoside phosphorylase [Microbacterium esteraromaticum]|uniref:Uridine phosphorylase n=1 Tax=Microbacterium esteraromaticum TaxID=57043 RepID=A0A7D7WH18_9MICO|nr:nucleoside phosphorylase [Microbacterium esteraromaticum]QMU97354.1 nucleoside phosphorylase [Microbacterium esteraromaticum]
MSSTWNPYALYESYRLSANVPRRGLLVEGRPALSQFDPQKVARYVLLTVRDPLCAYDEDPATQLARRLDDAEQIGRSGMFTTWTGRYRDVALTVVSGGSGSPEAELIMHELLEFTDADTFVRVGGSGGYHPKVAPGDVVIASGVVRDEGMTQAYIPASYPAVASHDVVVAMARAADGLGQPFHIGVTRSSDSDFCGVGRPSVGGYFQPWHMDILETWARAGVLNGDRESAAIVTLAALFGKRGGSVCSVADNVIADAEFQAGAGHASSMDIALAGVVELAAMDAEAEAGAGLLSARA